MASCGILSLEVDSIIGIPYGAMQRCVTIGIQQVGIGFIVEQQRRRLHLPHGAGDDQGCQCRFRLGVIHLGAGAEQNTSAVRIALLGGEHQRGESGLRSKLHVGAVLDKLIDHREPDVSKAPTSRRFVRRWIPARWDFAPPASNARTVSRLPRPAATISGVSPDIMGMLGSAPAASSFPAIAGSCVLGGGVKRRCAEFIGVP